MFHSEKELVDLILKRFNNKWISIKKYNKENIEIITEINLWFWIPDIVIVNKKSKEHSDRTTHLNSFDISVLDVIRREKGISIDDIVNVTKARKEKINNSLSILVNESIITERKGKEYEFNNYNTCISDCIAIEVKLKNRRRALNQAYRYKWFANESYVLLPESNINPAMNNIDLFKKINVWLLGINEKMDIKIYNKVNKEKPISDKMFFLLNEYFIKK